MWRHGISMGLLWGTLMMPQSVVGQDRGGVHDVGTPERAIASKPLFEAVSAKDANRKLIFVLASDQPAAAVADPSDPRVAVGGEVWFADSFDVAARELLQRRPGLKDEALCQHARLGLPVSLTGNKPSPLPARSAVLLCDGNYRLLAWLIGVPEADDLARLVEDAEETRTLMSLHDDPSALRTALYERALGRVGREYKRAINEAATGTSWNKRASAGDGDGLSAPWRSDFLALIGDLRGAYLFDVRLRFALSDASDVIRLIVLEQHCETRRQWCDSISPFVVGQPLPTMLAPMLEAAWETPVIKASDPTEHDELRRWFQTRRVDDAVTLAIRPHLLATSLPWPPLDAGGSAVPGRSWRDLEKAMAGHPFRVVDAEQLAVVLKHADVPAINLLQPVRARYVVFSKRRKVPIVIRENELPGKFLRYFDSE